MREGNCRGVRGMAGMREGNCRGVRGIGRDARREWQGCVKGMAGMHEGEWRLIC